MRRAQKIDECMRDLASGKLTSRELTERCITRIKEQGEGKRAFIRLFEEQALAVATASDMMRAAGCPPGLLAGVPVSVKDVFDVAGTVTSAGSVALANGAPAKRDADVVTRLRTAGAAIVGATNMGEFAMNVLGLNPHYGTPRNAWERSVGRIPGGSSAGAAVSITDGMALAALGTDTMGSVRVPAALCGIVGFKPTARRVPLRGSTPLAPSLDSIGVLASSVTCCARVDAVIADDEPASSPPTASLRFAVPKTLALDELDDRVAAAFARALSVLSAAGCEIKEIPFTEIAELPKVNSKCNFHIAEGYAWHHDLLATKGGQYDPLIAKRLSSGASITAKEYIDMVAQRNDLIVRTRIVTRHFDAVLMPTVPFIAPRMADVANEDVFRAKSFLAARNTSIVNLLDRCALTLPCHRQGEAPVGLMMVGETMADKQLLAIARYIEAVLNPDPLEQ